MAFRGGPRGGGSSARGRGGFKAPYSRADRKYITPYDFNQFVQKLKNENPDNVKWYKNHIKFNWENTKAYGNNSYGNVTFTYPTGDRAILVFDLKGKHGEYCKGGIMPITQEALAEMQKNIKSDKVKLACRDESKGGKPKCNIGKYPPGVKFDDKNNPLPNESGEIPESEFYHAVDYLNDIWISELEEMKENGGDLYFKIREASKKKVPSIVEDAGVAEILAKYNGTDTYAIITFVQEKEIRGYVSAAEIDRILAGVVRVETIKIFPITKNVISDLVTDEKLRGQPLKNPYASIVVLKTDQDKGSGAKKYIKMFDQTTGRRVGPSVEFDDFKDKLGQPVCPENVHEILNYGNKVECTLMVGFCYSNAGISCQLKPSGDMLVLTKNSFTKYDNCSEYLDYFTEENESDYASNAPAAAASDAPPAVDALQTPTEVVQNPAMTADSNAMAALDAMLANTQMNPSA